MLSFVLTNGLAQCPFNENIIGDVTPNGIGITVELINEVVGGSQYTIQAEAGCMYTISTCLSAWDSQLTVFDESQIAIAYNDDYCGTQSLVTFVALSTNEYTIQVNEFFCLSNSTTLFLFSVTLDGCGYGCTDEEACNYDPDAQHWDGACLSLDECGNCGGIDTQGCTNAVACNFDANADCDDGSCILPPSNDLCSNATVLDVGTTIITNTNACNNEGNGDSCTLWGEEQVSVWYSFTTPATPAEITIETSFYGLPSWNDTELILYGSCGGNDIACDDDSGDGTWSLLTLGCGALSTNTTYLLQVDGYDSNSGICNITLSIEQEPCTGCTDPEACNYDEDVILDDGTCILPDGCTEFGACNYDVSADCDDGSCLFDDVCGVCGGNSIAGCTDVTSANYNPSAGCDDGSCIVSFGELSILGPDSIFYSDTLEIQFEILNGLDIYACYVSMNFDETSLNLLDYEVGEFLGDEIISTPPVIIDGQIDFGASKIGDVPGSSGDGLFYTLRFLPNGPFNASPSPLGLQFTIASIDCFNDNGDPGSLFAPEPLIVELFFEAEVWPGDCDHNGEVSFLDLLPIGFFYNETGPVRPDPTIQWEAQLAPLWGTDNTTPASSFFKVFADGNGDGLINISDQAAIGFNLGQIVPDGLIESDPNEALEFAQQSLDVAITLEVSSAPATAVIPADSEVVFSVNAITELESMEDLYGFGLELTFPFEWISTSDPVINYTNTDLGTLGVDFLSFVNVTSGTIEIAITRTLPMTMSGNIHLFDVIVPLEESLLPGTKEMLVDVVAANDPAGLPVTITSASGFVDITNELLGFEVLLSTSNTICIGGGQGMAQASSSGGTEPYVYDWNGADPNDLMAGGYTLTVTDSDGVSEIVDFTIEDGLAICGCTYSDATNFDPIAQVDDGSCEFPPGGTETCEGDFSGDGSITTVDLLIFLALYDSECPE